MLHQLVGIIAFKLFELNLNLFKAKLRYLKCLVKPHKATLIKVTFGKSGIIDGEMVNTQSNSYWNL